mgnify:CR=1 FL=1|jgi:hypothetical protein
MLSGLQWEEALHIYIKNKFFIMPQKKVREWYDTMSEPERTQAYDNVKSQWPELVDTVLNDTAGSLYNSFQAVHLGKTPQGLEYWKNIARKYGEKV